MDELNTLSEDPETGKWYNFVFLLESSQFEGAAFDISFSNYVDTEAYMGDILVMDGETLYNYYGSDTYAVEHYVRQADGSYQLKEKQDGLPASYNAAVSAEPVPEVLPPLRTGGHAMTVCCFAQTDLPG